MPNKVEPLYLQVMNRNGIVYQGRVGSVSSSNLQGAFDVIDLHTNFISLLNAPLIVHTPEGKVLQIPAENGVMKVFENKISVYLGIKTGLR